MRKKTAIALTSLLILTVMLTMPNFTPSTTAQAAYHWKIMLAQKGCNARIVGNLTDQFGYIPGSDFDLVCNCTLPEPQPLGQFVFWKVGTEWNITDIHYTKYIDVNKNGTWDIVEPIGVHPIPMNPEEPHTVYQHVEEGTGPFGPWMVVVEVREQPYDEKGFEWQITMKQENCNVLLIGNLTLECTPIAGFNILCNCTKMQCQVVRTPWCTVPNDINFTKFIWHKDYPSWELAPSCYRARANWTKYWITQFPWTHTESGIWCDGTPWTVTLELTEVQMHRYITMGGGTDSAGSLGPGKAYWEIGDYIYDAGTPFATRPPLYWPMMVYCNITFTQRDPITGIVKLGVPDESWGGFNHVWFGNDTKTWYNLTISLEEQGCGWIFTGIGKDPILGDVNVTTYNDYSGVYSLKPGYENTLLAGPLDPADPAYPAYGAGPPIGPCLQKLRGPDGIPGTADDPIGDGTKDPPGSSILYIPGWMNVRFWVPGAGWQPMFETPWPQLMTTATATDTVIEPQSELNGLSTTQQGEPWEFLAGLQGQGPVLWKHSKCNAYVTYVCAWSVLRTYTALGWLDSLFYIVQKAVREDCVIADIDCNEEVDLYDIVKIGIAYGAKDETFPDRPKADPNYDARADLKPERGLIDLYDLVRCAIDYGSKLTPNCIIRP